MQCAEHLKNLGVKTIEVERVAYYPVDENDMPIIRMAEITDYHFVGGTVDFPEEVSYAPCKRVGLSSAAVEIASNPI